MEGVSVVDSEKALAGMLKELHEISMEPAVTLAPELSSNEEAFNYLKSQAIHMLVEDQIEEIVPVFTLVLGNNQIVPILTPFGDNENSKQTCAQLVRTAGIVTRAKRYTHMSEAWMANMSAEEGKDFIKSDRQVKDRDDKIEVVIMVVGDQEGTLMKPVEVVRDWETGKVTGLQDLMDKPMKAEGRFADLLVVG